MGWGQLVRTRSRRYGASPAAGSLRDPDAEGADRESMNGDTCACLRAVAARRENHGGDGHRRTFIRSTPAERSEGEGAHPLTGGTSLRLRRGWGTGAVAKGANL